MSPASVTALDGFNAYVQELMAALVWDPADPNRHTEASGPHTPPVPAARSRQIPDGHALASQGTLAQTDLVPGATHSTDRRVRVDLERLAGESEQAGHVGKPARAARAVGEHAPAPRARPPARRPRARKRGR